MSHARVESLDVLRGFKAALVKFIEASNVALVDAESDLNRTRLWVETEQLAHWNQQLRKRTEALARAEEALRMKKVFKDVTGARQSYVDEEKAVQKARRALEHAQQKMAATQGWKRRLEKVANDYRGNVQRLATTVGADLPAAVAKVENLLRSLEAYTAEGPAEVTSTAAPTEADAARAATMAGSMARAAADDTAPVSDMAAAASTETPPVETAAQPDVAGSNHAGDQ